MCQLWIAVLEPPSFDTTPVRDLHPTRHHFCRILIECRQLWCVQHKDLETRSFVHSLILVVHRKSVILRPRRKTPLLQEEDQQNALFLSCTHNIFCENYFRRSSLFSNTQEDASRWLLAHFGSFWKLRSPLHKRGSTTVTILRTCAQISSHLKQMHIDFLIFPFPSTLIIGQNNLYNIMSHAVWFFLPTWPQGTTFDIFANVRAPIYSHCNCRSE